MKSNLASIIMPVFNAGKYVREAIESVLSQSYADIELICINDQSTDKSLSVLESFGKKIILIDSENNCGTAESRNKGIRIAGGEYLAFIDNDDIWESNKLELQINQLRTNPGLDIISCYMQCFISPDISEEIKNIRHCPPDPMEGCIPSTIVIKRSSFDKVGYFESRWKNGESVAWMFKAKDAGLKFGMVDDVLVKRRIHKTNKSALDPATSKSEYLRIVKESLDRRRNR